MSRVTGAVAARLAGGRLHLQHGPIDLVIGIDGEARAVAAAERRAADAFAPVLDALVGELGALRSPVSGAASPAGAGVGCADGHVADPHAGLVGPVARRMAAAARPWHPSFVTPMAAVAGAVADHVLAAILGADGAGVDGASEELCGNGRGLRRAAVNDGGDIALWLASGERYRVGLCTDPHTGELAGRAELAAGDGVGGVATSGRLGRSRSLGIADAVTVLARTAAAADVAATLIANAVDLPDDPRVERVPAHELSPDSDLGARAVTVGVARLDAASRARALDAGARAADACRRAGTIDAAFLHLQGRSVTVGRRGIVRPFDRVGAISRDAGPASDTASPRSAS